MQDPLHGQKYLLDGWWMNTRDGPGWFFRKQFEDTLVAHGARRTTLLVDQWNHFHHTTLTLGSQMKMKIGCSIEEVQGDDDEDDASDPDYTPDGKNRNTYTKNTLKTRASDGTRQ